MWGTTGLYPNKTCVHRAGRNFASCAEQCSEKQTSSKADEAKVHAVTPVKIGAVSKYVMLLCSRVSLQCDHSLVVWLTSLEAFRHASKMCSPQKCAVS